MADQVDVVPSTPGLWLRPLQQVWRALDGLQTLSDVATVHRGMEYRFRVREAAERLVAHSPQEGFRLGLLRVEDGFEPYVARGLVYLNTSTEVMHERSQAHLLPWHRGKVIVNAKRLSRGPWVMAGAADHDGLVVYRLFHAIWPTGGLPLDVLAAIVNGPVANAFVIVNRTSRDNRIGTLNRIPVPNVRAEAIAAIGAAVDQYRTARLKWLAQPDLVEELEQRCREALLRVDAELLTAYDLPPRVERELLDHFAGHRRPGPVAFDRYYPEGFGPSLPLRMLVSGEVGRASADQTLQRVPVLRDPVISEMLAELG